MDADVYTSDTKMGKCAINNQDSQSSKLDETDSEVQVRKEVIPKRQSQSTIE